MQDKTYVITEIVGVSENSISQAVANAIARANQTLKALDWFEVKEVRGTIVDGKVVVRGTAAALGHAMECAPLQNLVLAVAALERGVLFPPLEPGEPIEAEFEGALRQILVTSWGHLKGEGMILVEAIDG